MPIKKLQIDDLEISELGLGGGKMVTMDLKEGHALMDEAIKLGINVFDGHHRYGKAEKIIGSHKAKAIKMTKVSAYKKGISEALVKESLFKMPQIDIMWISDLDNGDLYRWGEEMYNTFKGRFPRLGITSESGDLVLKFKNTHPECKYFMVPVHKGDVLVKQQYRGNEKMFGFIQEAKSQGKFVFGIKPFCDGLHFGTYSVKQCLQTAKDSGVDCVLIGTKNIKHLKECAEIYERI